MNAAVIVGLLAFGGWLTHIFTCFADGLWGFLIAGAIMFPVSASCMVGGFGSNNHGYRNHALGI
jgi:hypothetical protein